MYLKRLLHIMKKQKKKRLQILFYTLNRESRLKTNSNFIFDSKKKNQRRI